MNKLKLKKEGEKWVRDGIITEEQLDHILAKYVKNDHSYILVLLAVLLTSIGILIFIFSDWAQELHVSRIIMMLASMVVLYGFGHYFFIKSIPDSSNKPFRIYGISFIVLGYIFFGATLFLLLNMYQVNFLSVWPFIIWSLVGLLLFFIYEHPILLIIGLMINLFAQLYSGLAFSSFNLFIFAIFLVGYIYHVYRREHSLFSYLFAIGLSMQIVIYTTVELDQYYWYLFFILIMYGLGEALKDSTLKRALMNISLLSVFIFKTYESFGIQEIDFVKEIDMQVWFFILLGVGWLVILFLKWRHNRGLDLIDFILFIPLFFLPNAYLFIIGSMFIYSLFWLVIGFQRQIDRKIKIGIITFIISTFTVYIQYAWETLNKSLFFIIGGILLFFLSFILEKQRRKTEQTSKGDDLK